MCILFDSKAIKSYSLQSVVLHQTRHEAHLPKDVVAPEIRNAVRTGRGCGRLMFGAHMSAAGR